MALKHTLARAVNEFLGGNAVSEEYIKKFIRPKKQMMLGLGMSDEESNILIGHAIQQSSYPFPLPGTLMNQYMARFERGESIDSILNTDPEWMV